MDAKFSFFTGDVNYLAYGGVWARKVGEMRYHFIRLDNMDECCGRDNEGRPRYSIQLEEVDIDAISGGNSQSLWSDAARNVRNAMESCGLIQSADNPVGMMAVAEACRSYGLASPLHSVATNNARKGITECRKESYRLTQDAEAYEEAMSRPVNRIGSTAREYGKGDLQSALVRGIESNNPDAVLMGKMYHNTGGQTLGGNIDIRPITDALARR